MSFVSYAQNFEDVMLWRALKHIKEGFYIDIGAWSPDLDTVTKAFYERGWHGINIEPHPEMHAQLRSKRPHDINLKVAISDRTGFLEMNFLSNTGLSTFDDTIADKHRESGWDITKQQVETMTLASVWQTHVPTSQEVHFLKVDVEGWEETVLQSNDWVHCRPWIVVVESTLPMSQEESHAAWEDILLSAGYQFAYADGLNRFYVAQEHLELLSTFKYPPNFFDEFVLCAKEQADERAKIAEAQLREKKKTLNVSQTALAEQQARVQWLQNELDTTKENLKALTDELAITKTHLAHLTQKAKELQGELYAVFHSKSWRITWPLRKLMQFLKWMFRLPKRTMLRLLIKTIDIILNKAGLRYKLSKCLYRYPKFKIYLKSLYEKIRAFNSLDNRDTKEDLQASILPIRRLGVNQLNPLAARVYADLKYTIDKKNS